MSEPASELRQRTTFKKATGKSGPAIERAPSLDDVKKEPEEVYGKTPDGTVFAIPQTHDVLSSLFDPRLPKSHVDLLTLVLLGSQFILFLALPIRVSRFAFLALFAVWRLAYDVGLGWLLRQQSENRYIVRMVKRHGWMDPSRRPKASAWTKAQLTTKMGEKSNYVYEKVPVEYNVWLFFRHLADIILLNDFLSYCFFAWSWLQFPAGQSVVLHICRWLAGWSLIFFNLWVKIDAHRVVKDYAWYWGDCFFQQMQDLVFDGVFSLAPHPMYSVGYAGYYGLSLVVGSTTVLYASMLAHACQFAFLVYFENPHIERTYGTKKPLAMRARMPVHGASTPVTERDRSNSETSTDSFELLDKQTAAEESDEVDDLGDSTRQQRKRRRDSVFNLDDAAHKPRVQTRHDLHHRYFSKDVVILHNFDPYRAADFGFALALFYGIVGVFILPLLSRRQMLVFAFVNALGWRLFHSFGLGLLLQAQSRSKWLVRHFVKHYYYETDEGDNAVAEAFRNWKSIYNWSLCMVYASFAGLAFQCWQVPDDWTFGSILLRHTGGLALILLHVWTSLSTFDVLREFGWFYGDFFLSDYPKELLYTGIYRFLNNPERIMGGAAFFGMALIAGSKLVAFLAIISVLSHFWFLRNVENPHMELLYGQAIRKDAGLTRTIRDVAEKNVQRAPLEVRKAVRELQGTFEKVAEETTEAVGDFLRQAAPLLSEYMADSRILLQQSRERLLITRVASDLDAYDRQQYKLEVKAPVASNADDLTLPDTPRHSGKPRPPRFAYGDSITLSWQAPENHSRSDWIGIYRTGSNHSTLVTRVSSRGKWVGIYNAEWDGDTHVPGLGPATGDEASTSSHLHSGTVTFERKKLPKGVGMYEFRYHHGGMHNVMASAGPIEIYVEKPSDADSWTPLHSTLGRVVCACLGNNQAHIPRSALKDPSQAPKDDRFDDDDFVVWDADQADRISYAIKEACGVELSHEVVVADANVSKLTNRVLEARRVLKPWSGGGSTVATSGDG